MDESLSYPLIIIGLSACYALAVAVRCSFNKANLTRLLVLYDLKEGAVKRTADLLPKAELLDRGSQYLRLLIWSLAVGIFIVMQIKSSGVAAMRLAQWIYLAVGALLLFLLELGIEAAIARQPEAWAVRLSWLAGLGLGILSPVAWLANRISPDKASSAEPQGVVTQEEFIHLLDAGHDEGMLEPDEREMIYSIFRLNDTLVREIMVPRIYITALDVNTSLPEAADALLSSGHSRAPVYEQHIDNIIGLIYAKDLLRAWRENMQTASLRSLLREVYFVPEAKKVDELLDEMQSRQVHMAIVVDEYGGIAGLVTLEDIVEEIVGEIRDEYDEKEELPYQAVGEGEYLVQGRIDLDDFNALMHTNLPRDEAETLSGFIYNKIGRVPENGEKIQVDHLELIVEQVTGRRIRKVRARCLPDVESFDEEQKENHVDA